jgi:hypothetical protein
MFGKKPNPIKHERSTKSIAESIYYLLKERGNIFLGDFLRGDRLEKIDRIYDKENETYYYPYYIKRFLDKYDDKIKNYHRAREDFLRFHKQKALENIDNEFKKIIGKLNKNLGNIHMVLLDYFHKYYQYWKIVKVFEIQFQTIKNIIKHLFNHLPKEIKEEKEKKREKKREEKGKEKEGIFSFKNNEREVKFYKMKPKINFRSYSENIKFEVKFPILTKWSFYGITFPLIEEYEEKYLTSKLKKLIKRLEEMPKTETEKNREKRRKVKKLIKSLENRIKSYNKGKREILERNYVKELRKELSDIEGELMKKVNEFIKGIYKYEKELIARYNPN